jgi:hypothetical protein
MHVKKKTEMRIMYVCGVLPRPKRGIENWEEKKRAKKKKRDKEGRKKVKTRTSENIAFLSRTPFPQT